MRVITLDSHLEAAWNEYLEHCPDPETGIYHTLQWRDVTREVFGHQAHYLMVESGGTIEGILPLFLVRGLLGRQLISMPLRDRGGPLAHSGEVRNALLKAAADLYRELGCTTLELKTLAPIPDLEAAGLPFQQDEYWKNTLVTLPSDPEELWKRLHKKSVRWAVRKSIRNGVVARWAESAEDYAAFYSMFLQTRRRLAVPPYGFELFDAIRRLLQPQGLARLVIAEHEGRAVSGMILFYFRDRVIEAYAASDDKALHLRPNNLILWEAMQDACIRGYRTYDFGGTSPKNTGLLRFKKRWGGEETTLATSALTRKGGKLFQRDEDGLMLRALRTAFKIMPTACSRRIGPFFTKKTG